MHIAWSITGAGRKRGLRPQAKDWVCPQCGAALRYYWKSCPNDGTPRPKD